MYAKQIQEKQKRAEDSPRAIERPVFSCRIHSVVPWDWMCGCCGFKCRRPHPYTSYLHLRPKNLPGHAKKIEVLCAARYFTYLGCSPLLQGAYSCAKRTRSAVGGWS